MSKSKLGKEEFSCDFIQICTWQNAEGDVLYIEQSTAKIERFGPIKSNSKFIQLKLDPFGVRQKNVQSVQSLVKEGSYSTKAGHGPCTM